MTRAGGTAGAGAGEGAPVLIVAAMVAELGGLPAGARACRLPGARLWTGTVAGSPVALAATGEGRVAAERGMHAVLGVLAPRGVLVVGVSGGLSPDLTAGSIIVGTRVVGTGHDLLPAPHWLDAARRTTGAKDAVLLTSGHVLSSAADKRTAWESLGAELSAAVDLETAAFAGIAAARGIPWLSLRAVSDAAAEDLPLDVERFRGRDGRIQRLRIAAHALRRPTCIPPVLALRRRLARCAETLARAVERLLPQLPPPETPDGPAPRSR